MSQMMQKLRLRGGHLDGPCNGRCGCRGQSGRGCGRFHVIVDGDDLYTEICQRIAKRLAETNDKTVEKELEHRLVSAVVRSTGH